VGDETRDIDAAREAGVQCAAVTWGIHSRQVLQKHAPAAIIDKPEELSISVFNKTREGHLL
jgi:phosphoglycolate phosphatase